MNYYNDNDPFCCKWLAELMNEGLIPDGYIDNRSIKDVRPSELEGYDQHHFFAGIAGWPRALELAGWNSARPVWSASLPCQPPSCAGQQRGHEDERHLWPVFFDLVEVCRPAIIIGEQVASKDGREWFAGISTDLETLEYSVAAADLPAAGVASPHKRNRLFWVANAPRPKGTRQRQQRIDVSGKTSIDLGITSGSGLQGHEQKELCRARRWEKGRTVAEPGSPTNQLADSESDNRGSGKRGTQTGVRQDGIGRRGSAGGGFWSNSALIPCADGKWRRVPSRMEDTNGDGSWNIGTHFKQSRRQNYTNDTESGSFNSDRQEIKFEIEPALFPMVTRLSDTMGDSWHDGIVQALTCFPLSESIPGRVGLLKGSGNSIVPQVAAEFIAAVMEIVE